MADAELQRKLLQTFHIEAQEHLQKLNEALLQLERQPDEQTRRALLQEAFRAAHSLKGAARAVSLSSIETLAHALESVLQQARDADLVLTPATCDVLYDVLDMVPQLLQDETLEIEPLHARLTAVMGDAPAASPTPEAKSAPEAEPRLPLGDDTIRVTVGKLDDLMAQAGELVISEISATQRLRDVRALRSRIGLWSKTWREIKTLLSRLDGDDAARRLIETLMRHHDYMQALAREINALEQATSRDTLNLSTGVTKLQDEVRRVRLVPFQTLVPGLQRIVRDVARSEDKRAVLSVEGGEVELDKKVLETLKDPLLHLLRNAVIHGLETPERRQAVGKPEEGQVSIMVHQQGSEVHITVRDDGRGFDLPALVQSRRLVDSNFTPDDKADPNDLIAQLAFQPGITTAGRVTEMAGRGMGLDVVRQGVEELRGRIKVVSLSGQGATIRLVVPVSLTMSRGLLVQVGNERYALPLIAVEKIEEVRHTFSVEGLTMIHVGSSSLPIVPLAAILKRPTNGNGAIKQPLAVILNVAEQRLAVLVDDVMTEQELAVKPLEMPLRRVINVEGTALLGTGEPVIVLNPTDLIKSARRVRVPVLSTNHKNSHEKGPMAHILVVDDSITTRTLEKNILEAAGYRVTTAINGEEALKQLEENSIDLVVADIQMPRLDGFALTQRLRESAEHGSLPIILVTSLEGPEDRERGLRAGADAYIVKRGFDQAELLATLERLL
jgi:two-component system chemotaxis sensor kinase CheA